MPEINPCKCGNTMCGVSHRTILGTTYYAVSCLICEEEGAVKENREDAIEAWNNREPANNKPWERFSLLDLWI